MSKFNVGDRVRVIAQRDDLEPEDAAPGDIGVVVTAEAATGLQVLLDKSHPQGYPKYTWWFDEADLELETPEASGEGVLFRLHLDAAEVGGSIIISPRIELA